MSNPDFSRASSDRWGGCNCDGCSRERFAVWRSLAVEQSSNVQGATERFDDILVGRLNPSPAARTAAKREER